MMAILAVVGIGALIVPIAIWRGFVLAQLWIWFAVPVFDVEPLTIAQALGIGIVISLFTSHLKVEDASSKMHGWERAAYQVIYTIIGPGIALLAGWGTTWFLP